MRDLPPARHQRCDVLSLEIEIRRDECLGTKRLKETEGEVTQYKRIMRNARENDALKALIAKKL